MVCLNNLNSSVDQSGLHRATAPARATGFWQQAVPGRRNRQKQRGRFQQQYCTVNETENETAN